MARHAQHRHIIGLAAAIATIEQRLAAPTADTLSAAKRKARRKAKEPKGYASQAERFAKQRRCQRLRAELARAQADRAKARVRVVEGGKRLARVRHHLDTAGLSINGWRDRWDAARYRIAANGSPDEPFGNPTITVTPAGQISIRSPKPLERLANAPRGRYVLSCPPEFPYRHDEWAQRIRGANSVSYTITRKPGRAGRYLSAAWAIPPLPYQTRRDDTAAGEDVYAPGPVVGVDLNDGHLAVRRLDAHGNPVGAAQRIEVDLSGRAARRDAHIRHAITTLLRYTQRHGLGAIAVEDLDFADARALGRETMGRGQRGKRFRATVSGIPTAVFGNRLAGMATMHGHPGQHRGVRGQLRLQQRLGRPALAAPLSKRHPTPGGRHGDRASRPRPSGPATERCDTAATGGSRGESYQPDRTTQPTGEHQKPTPAKDARNRISPALPERTRRSGPGNRYPGVGQQ